MATVRVWQRSVEQAPLAQPRPVQADTSGLRALAHGVAQVVDVAAAASIRAAEDARTTREKDAANQLARTRLTLEDAARQAKGRVALEVDILGGALKGLDDESEKLTAGMTDQVLADRVRQHAQDQRLQLGHFVSAHINRERDALDRQNFRDSLDLADLDARRSAMPVAMPDGRPAIGDPEGIARAIEVKKGAIVKEAGLLGMDQQWVETQTAAQLGAVHQAVVESLMAGENPQPQLAAAYLNQPRVRADAPEVVEALKAKLRPGLVSEAARSKAAELERLTPGDVQAQLAAADAIKDSALAEATRERVKARYAERRAFAADVERQTLGRIFVRIEKAGGYYSFGTDPDFESLSDAGKASAWERLSAERRQALADSKASSAESAEARRLQAEENKIALSRFAELPLREQLSVDLASTFPSADRVTLAALGARKARAKQLSDKGLEVEHGEFQQRVKAFVGGLGVGKSNAQQITLALDGWFYAWQKQSGHEGKLPGAKEVDEAMAYTLLKLDIPWGIDRFAYEIKNPSQYQPLPPEKQPHEVTRALAAEILAGKRPATALAAKAAPAVGTQVPGETLGYSGGTFEMQANGKWKRVK